jgi:hypothetical protein
VDIVALANSGGGIVFLGLDSTGAPSGESIAEVGLDKAAKINPAMVVSMPRKRSA